MVLENWWTHGSWFSLVFQSLYRLHVWKVSTASHVVLLFEVLLSIIVNSLVCQECVNILVSNIPLTHFGWIFRHDHIIQQCTGWDSSHCGRLTQARTWQLWSRVSTCLLSLQSSWLSFPETMILCCLLSTHLQSMRSSQGLPMYEGESN